MTGFQSHIGCTLKILSLKLAIVTKHVALTIENLTINCQWSNATIHRAPTYKLSNAFYDKVYYNLCEAVRCLFEEDLILLRVVYFVSIV